MCDGHEPDGEQAVFHRSIAEPCESLVEPLLVIIIFLEGNVGFVSGELADTPCDALCHVGRELLILIGVEALQIFALELYHVLVIEGFDRFHQPVRDLYGRVERNTLNMVDHVRVDFVDRLGGAPADLAGAGHVTQICISDALFIVDCCA